MSKFAPIRVVSPSQFDKSTAQTPGSERRAALARELGVETGLWSGLFSVQPGAKTAIHHHGEQETIAYVLKGECYVRWGERGEFSAVARQGSFIHVPAWLPHMEINQSLNSSFEWVVVRSTAEPIVVNLPMTTGTELRLGGFVHLTTLVRYLCCEAEPVLLFASVQAIVRYAATRISDAI